jgi:UDP-N-acetylmuramate: L-alanyl-gamma-D-glutamyl-meso-diaminopimelate ligase
MPYLWHNHSIGNFFYGATDGGILVYNENDPEVKRVSEAATNPIRVSPIATL